MFSKMYWELSNSLKKIYPPPLPQIALGERNMNISCGETTKPFSAWKVSNFSENIFCCAVLLSSSNNNLSKVYIRVHKPFPPQLTLDISLQVLAQIVLSGKIKMQLICQWALTDFLKFVWFSV